MSQDIKERLRNAPLWNGSTLHADAADHIEALERQLAERQAPERIKTAPRDGTEILAWSAEGKNWHQVYWKSHKNWSWLPKFEAYWSMRWNDEYYQADGHFTHWTPLPAAPSAGQAKQTTEAMICSKCGTDRSKAFCPDLPSCGFSGTAYQSADVPEVRFGDTQKASGQNWQLRDGDQFSATGKDQS